MKNKAPLHSPRPPPQDLVDAYLHSQNECKQNTGIESNADIDTGARRSSTDGNHGSYRRNTRRASWCLSKREENKPSISVLLKKLREKSEQFFDLSEMFLLIDNKGRDILDLPPGFDSSPAAALQRCQEEKNTMTELAASNQIYLEIEKTDMNTVRASHAFAYTSNPPPLPFQLRHSKLVSAKSQEDISSSEFHIQDTYNSADNDDNDNMDTLQSKLQQQFQSQPQSQSHLQMQMQLHRHRLEHQSNQNYCPSARDVPLVKQGDLAFYSPSNIISRLLCMYDPLILYITKVFWHTSVRVAPSYTIMKKDEYFRIFALIHHHLLPHTPVRDAVNTISQDWEADLALLSEDSDRESTDENHESSSNTGSGGGNFAPRNISIHQCGSLNTTASRHRSTASQKRRAHTRKNINIFSPHHDYFMSRKDRAREERNRIHQPHTINRMKSMSQSSEKKRNDGDDVHLSEDRSKALLPSNTSSSTANIDLDGRPINKITSGEHFNHQLNDPYRKDTEKGITLAILHRSLFQLADHWTYTNGQPVDYFRFLRDIYVQITDGRGLKRGSDISLQSNVQDEKNSPDDGQKNHENECEKNGNAKDTSDSDHGNRENRPASLSSTASQLWVKCASQTSSIFFTPIQPSTKGPVPPSPVSQLTTPPNPHSIPQGVERTNIARKSPRNGIIHISGNMKTNKRRYKYKDSSSSQDHPYFSFIRPSHLYSHIDHHHQQNKKHGRRWKAVPTAYLTEIYSRGIFSAAQYNRYCCRTENNARFAESDISNKTDHVMIIKNGTEQRNNSGKAISGKNASNVIPKKVVHLHNDTSNNNVNDGYSDNIIINCKNNNNSNNNHNHDRSSTYRKTSGDRYSRCNIRNNMIKDVIDDDEEGKEIDSDLETPQLSRQNSFNEGSDGISSKNDIRCKRNGREERAGGDNNNNIRTSRDGGDKQNAFFHKGGVLQHLDHGKNARKGTYPRDKFKNSHRSTIISSSSLTTESSSLSSFSALPSSPGTVYRKRSQRRNQRLRRRQQNIDIATILDMNPLLERMLGVEPRYTLNTCDSSDDDCNDGSESDAEHATSQMGSETTENNKNEASNIRKKDDKKREEGKVNVDTSFRVVNNNTKYTLSERAPGKIRLGVSLMKPKIHQIGTPVSIEQPPPEPPLQSTAAASMMRISSQYKSGSTSNVLSLSFPLYTASSRGANTIENRIFSSKSVVIAAVTADSQDAKVNFKDYDKEGDTNDKDSVYESRPQKEEWEQEVSEMNGQNGRGKDRRHIDNSDNKIIEDDTKDPRSVKLPLSYSPTVSSNVSSTKSITQPLIAVTAVTAPVSAAITPRGRLQSLPVRSETMSHSTTITNILKEKRRESIKRLKLYNHLMADLQDNHNAIVKVFFSENRCDTNHDENGNDIESGENIKCNFASQKEMQLQEAVVRTEGSLHGLQECDVTTTFQLLSTALSQLKASVTYSGAESAKSNAQMAKQVEVNFSLFEGFFHRPILLQSPSPVPATISLPSSFLSTQSTSHSLQLPSPSDSVEWVQRLLKLLLMDWRRQKRVLKRVEEFSEKMIAKTNTLTKLRVRRKKAEQLQHRRQKERKDKEQHTFSSFFSSSSFTSTSSTNGYLNRGIIATREADNIAADNNRIVNGGGTECRHDSRSVLVLPTSEDMISELVPSLTSYQEQEDRDITFLTTLSHRIEVSSSSSSSSSSTIFPTLSRSFFMKHDHILLLNTIDQVLPILRQLRGESYLYGLIHQSHQGGEPSKISQEKKDGRRGFDGVDTTINTRNPHASTPSPNRLNDKSKSKYQKYYDIYLVLIAVILCQRRKKLEKEARLTALRSKMRYSLIQSSHLQSQPSVALIQAQFEREWPKRWSILWGKDLQFSVKKAMIEIDTIILSLHHHRREGQRTKEEDERKERWSLFVSLDTHQLASADEAPRDDERPSDDQSGAISAVNKLEGADNDDNGGDEKDTKLKVDEQGMQRLSQHRQQSLERWLSLKSMHIEALIRESEKDIEITEKSIDDVENRSGDLRFFQRQGILVKHLKLADENIQKDANTDRLSNGRRKSKMKSRLMMKLKVISTLEKPKKHPVKCTRTQSKLTRTDSKTSTRHQMNWKPKKTKKQLRKRRSRKTVSGGNTGSTDRTEPKTDAGDEDSEKDVYFGSIGRRKRTIGNKIRSKMDREAELRDIIDNNGDNKESIDGSESNSVSSESSTESIYSVSSDDDMEFETDSGSSTSDNTKDSYFDDDLDSVYDENLGDARKGKQEGKEVIMEDFGMKLQEKGKEELRGGNNAIIEDISIMLEQSRTLKRNDIKLTQRAQLKRSVDIDSRMETTDKISETNGGKHNEIPRQRSDTNKSYVIKGKEKENISLCGQNRTGLDFNGSVSSMSEMRNIFHIGRIQGLLTRLSLLVEPKTYHTPISLSMGTISLNEETGTLRRDVKEEWEEKEKKKKQYQYERGGMGLVGESEMKSTVGQGCCSRNAVLNVSDKKEMITDAGREKQNKKGESSEHGVSQGAYYASSMDLIMRLKALRSEKDHGNTYNENGDKDKDADHVCWKREVDETFSGSYSTSASSSLNRRNHAESEVNADDGAPKQDIAFTPLTSVCQTWPTFARRETGYLSKVFICDKDNGNGSSSSDLRVESQRGRKLRIGSKPRKRWKRTKVKAKKQVKTDDVDWCKPKKCVRPPYSSFHRENNHSHRTPNSIRPQTAWVRAVKTWRTNVQDLLEHSSDGIRSKSSYVAGLGWRPRSAMVNPSSPSSSSKQPEIVVRRPIYSPHWNSAGDTGTASYGRRTNKHDRSHKSDTSYMKSAENKFRNKEVRVNQHQGCESTRSRPHSSYNYFLSHQSSNALSKSYQRPSSSSAYFSVPLHGKKDVIDASRRTHRAFRPSTARGYFCHIGDYNSKSRKNTKSNHGAFRKSSSRSDTHVGTKQANHVCHRNIVNATSRLGATKTVYVGPNFGAAVIQFKDGDATANKKIISGNTNIRFAIRETCESVRTREHKKARGRQSTGDSVGVGNMDDD